MITPLISIGILAFAFGVWRGWAGITFTGITKPLCQVSLFGFNFWVKKPEQRKPNA